MPDAWLLLGEDGEILAITWLNPVLEKSHGAEWGAYLHKRLPELPDLQFDPAAGELVWRGDRFAGLEFSPGGGVRWLLLKRSNAKEQLFESALDNLRDGVQIYSANAELIYINPASRRLAGIPGHIRAEGRHLMDLYDVEEEVSTTMTCLRSRRPVINRFDSFKSAEGKEIASVNTAYPIFDDQRLIGAVVFEQDLNSIRAQVRQMEELRDTFGQTALPVGKFNGYRFSDLVGQNRDFRAAVSLAEKIAAQDCNVLLVGETGTGKEIFAQGIHKASDRHLKKFVAVNCAAVPETLIESLFFGTSRGSFTGSVDKPGLLEEARGGVLFLDEMNSMSLAMQSKLLRVIQENSFRRVGGSRDIRADVRFVSSCNEAPSALIENNILRKDLFYRLSTVTIDIPPLRERADDIGELARFYLARNIGRYAKAAPEIDPELIGLLERHPWPGNVRELFNVLDYMLNTVEGGAISARHLPKTFAAGRPGGPEAPPAAPSPPPADFWETTEEDLGLGEILRAVERRVIERALLQSRYKLGRAAARLKLSRQNLQYRIKKLGLE